MLRVVLAVALLAAGAQSQGGYALAGHRAAPDAIAIEGTIQLSPGEAYKAAESRARDRATSGLRAAAEQKVEALRPFWMPDFATESIVDQWLRRARRKTGFEVLDHHTIEREHVHGNSYQTTLAVRYPELTSTNDERWFAHQVDRAGETLLIKVGSLAGFWVLLALATAWLDRLSRGYMTWRLRLIALAAGLGAAPIVYLI